MGLDNNAIFLNDSGSLFFAPAGTGYVAGTSATASIAGVIKYIVTSSRPYGYRGANEHPFSGSNYYPNPSEKTGSYWNFPITANIGGPSDGYYVYYCSESTATYDGNTVNNYASLPDIFGPHFPITDGFLAGVGSDSVGIKVYIATGEEAKHVASASVIAINESTATTYVTATLSHSLGAASASEAAIVITQKNRGQLTGHPFMSGSVNPNDFSYDVVTSGSGLAYTNAYQGDVDYESSSSMALQLDGADDQSFVISGSNNTKLYISRFI